MMNKEILGINLNEENQLNLLDKFGNFYNELPFEDNKNDFCEYIIKKTK
jgi:hypothetical protein